MSFKKGIRLGIFESAAFSSSIDSPSYRSPPSMEASRHNDHNSPSFEVDTEESHDEEDHPEQQLVPLLPSSMSSDIKGSTAQWPQYKKRKQQVSFQPDLMEVATTSPLTSPRASEHGSTFFSRRSLSFDELCNLFSYIEFEEAVKLRGVCRAWNSVLVQNSFWVGAYHEFIVRNEREVLFNKHIRQFYQSRSLNVTEMLARARLDWSSLEGRSPIDCGTTADVHYERDSGLNDIYCFSLKDALIHHARVMHKRRKDLAATRHFSKQTGPKCMALTVITCGILVSLSMVLLAILTELINTWCWNTICLTMKAARSWLWTVVISPLYLAELLVIALAIFLIRWYRLMDATLIEGEHESDEEGTDSDALWRQQQQQQQQRLRDPTLREDGDEDELNRNRNSYDIAIRFFSSVVMLICAMALFALTVAAHWSIVETMAYHSANGLISVTTDPAVQYWAAMGATLIFWTNLSVPSIAFTLRPMKLSFMEGVNADMAAFWAICEVLLHLFETAGFLLGAELFYHTLNGPSDDRGLLRTAAFMLCLTEISTVIAHHAKRAQMVAKIAYSRAENAQQHRTGNLFYPKSTRARLALMVFDDIVAVWILVSQVVSAILYLIYRDSHPAVFLAPLVLHPLCLALVLVQNL